MTEKKIFALALVLIVAAVGLYVVSLRLSFHGTEQSHVDSPKPVSSTEKLLVTMPPKPKVPLVAPTPRWQEAAATTVQAPKTYATSTVQEICTGNSATNFPCYQEYYTALIKANGIAAAFSDLKARYPNNPYVQSVCHPLTHIIGRIAAESYTNVGDAYTHGDSFCWSGYYHGVLETFVARVGIKDLARDINSICSSLNTDGKYGFNYFNCVHGLGHGLMAITDDQLFTSLTYCDALAGGWEQQSCAGGIYMENVIADGLDHITGYLDPKRPLYPCSDSPDKYKNSCYLMQTSYMLKIDGGNFSQTFAWCRTAGEYKDTCFQSLGRDASGRSLSDGPKTSAICMLGANQEEISNCVIGAVKDIISYFHSDTEAKDFCALFTDTALQTTCLDTAHAYYVNF